MNLTVQGRDAYTYTGGQTFDASRPTVVFIHGTLHDHSVWGLQTRALAHHGHAVLAVDLPGHGRSAGTAPASVEDAARWVVDLLEAAGVSRAALVGHSLGSLIALEAAVLLGRQATHLVMVGTTFPMSVSPALLAMAEDAPLAAIDKVNALSHSTLAAKPSAPSPGFWLHGANRALMRRMQRSYAEAGHGNLFLQDFRACDAYARGLEAAAQVRCPVNLILGSADQMTPALSADALARALRAETVTVPAGHSLMSEAPDAVLNALRSMLSGSTA